MIACCRYTYGDVNEYCYEQKHCVAKLRAHQFSGDPRRVVESLAVSDLQKYRTKQGNAEMWVHVVRNHKKAFDDRTVDAMRQKRAEAVASVSAVQRVISDAQALSFNPENTAIFNDKRRNMLAPAFMNVYIEPADGDDFTALPKFREEGGWKSPWFLWGAVVGRKEKGENTAEDNDLGDMVAAVNGAHDLAAHVSILQDDNDQQHVGEHAGYDEDYVAGGDEVLEVNSSRTRSSTREPMRVRRRGARTWGSWPGSWAC